MLERAEDHEILYSSYLYKRTKSHNWQKKWFVLRRNQLSYYKDSKEYKASKVISIDEILSFNEIPDNHKFHFIIVTGSRIYHLKAADSICYNQWIGQLDRLLNHQSSCHSSNSSIRSNKQINITLPSTTNPAQQKQQQQQQQTDLEPQFEFIRPQKLSDQSSSSPLNVDLLNQDLTNMQLSGTDDNFTSGGVSDYNYALNPSSRNQSVTSLPPDVTIPPPSTTTTTTTTSSSSSQQTSQHHHHQQQQQQQQSQTFQVPTPIPEEEDPTTAIVSSLTEPITETIPTSTYNSFASTTPEHVIAKGYLFRLKKRSLTQWRRYYIILTNHFILFFKTYKDSENSHIYKKINISDILDVVELDPLSKSKIYCMLIITPLKRIRFCAENEEELTKWLVLLKTIVKTRKKEKDQLAN